MEREEYAAMQKKLSSIKNAQIADLPPSNYAMIDGIGDPNTSPAFEAAIGALYAVSYGIKMLPKKGVVPSGYFDYKVSPLEGIWDVQDGQAFDRLHKDKLRWTLMIMQPPFVTQALFDQIRMQQKEKKGICALDDVRFASLHEGVCCQMMHIGPFDDEPATFAVMQQFIEQQGYKRTDHRHHEIYLSDFRRTAPQKLKTVLRYQITKNG